MTCQRGLRQLATEQHTAAGIGDGDQVQLSAAVRRLETAGTPVTGSKIFFARDFFGSAAPATDRFVDVPGMILVPGTWTRPYGGHQTKMVRSTGVLVTGPL